MIRLEKEAKSGGGTGVDEHVLEQLLEKAKSSLESDWDVSNGKTKKKAVKNLIAFLRDCEIDGDGVALPDEDSDFHQDLFSMITTETTAVEAVKKVAEKFGFTKANADADAKKEATAEKVCACPENGSLFLAIKELAGLYFDEGNTHGEYTSITKSLSNLCFSFGYVTHGFFLLFLFFVFKSVAGATYMKVSSAIKDLKFEITPENGMIRFVLVILVCRLFIFCTFPHEQIFFICFYDIAMSLCKAGPKKVAGIGPKSAAMMKEFLTTGTIEKLEQKRADAQP